MSIESVMPSNRLILCCPLLLLSIFPSIRAFSNESALHIRWPKYWSFSFNISPSSEYSGLFSIYSDAIHLPGSIYIQAQDKSLGYLDFNTHSVILHGLDIYGFSFRVNWLDLLAVLGTRGYQEVCSEAFEATIPFCLQTGIPFED